VLRFLVGDELANERLLRKIAHFGEFFLLSCEILLLFFAFGKRNTNSVLMAFFLGNFCALIDETIQIFSGRGSMVSDVWIDTSGAVTGILFILYTAAVLETVRENRRSCRAETEAGGNGKE